jgi:hypothetical protein
MPRPPAAPPETAAEAEARFWARYGWPLLVNVLGDAAPAVPPVTVEQWLKLAQLVRDTLQAPPAHRLALLLETAARELRASTEGDAS